MEYVAGGSLQDYLNVHGPADWRAIARLGAEVASGLAAAHERQLIHRDIKPSNILLLAEGDSPGLGLAKIADFGLARTVDETRLTLTGTVMGTPMYMAPEQARCEIIDARADLFSLGSVLYTLATGHEPFPYGTPVAVLRQVCETTPRPVRELNPAIPVWLAAIIERLHAKRPVDRFTSATEVAKVLRYNLEHPDQPRLVSPPRSVQRRRKRKRVLLGAVLALLVLTAGGTLTETMGWTHLTSRGLFAANGTDHLPLRATLMGHTGPVWAVAFAPDGKTVATGSDDTTLRFWDPATGHETARLAVHDSAVLAVIFSHSGKLLITGGGDGALRVWDAAGRTEQPELAHINGNVRRSILAPDDRTVAVASSTQGVELWDLERRTLRQTLAGHQGTIQTMAFSSDGRSLATGDTHGRIRLWDPANGMELASFQGDPLGVRALAFSPDSKTLASTGTVERDIKLWDVVTHERLATLVGFETDVMNMTFSPDGRLLAAGSRGGRVRLWEVSSGQPLATLEAHQGAIWSVAFSPDGHTLASAGEDRLAKLWDLSSLAEAPR
jgi:WD40 repeat protein